MKKRLVNFDYKRILKYLVLLFLFFLLNNLQDEVSPYSFSLLSVALALNCSIIFTPLLFLLSFVISGKIGLLFSCFIGALFLMLVFLIYKKTKTKMRYEIILFTAISLVPFLILGQTLNASDLSQESLSARIFVCLITLVITFFCFIAGKTISQKGLKYKLGYEEFASVFALVFCFGLGICNAITPYLFHALCVLIILITCYVYKKGTCVLIAGILGTSLAVFYGNVSYVSLFILYAIFAQSLMPFSRYVSAFSILLADYLVQAIFNFYSVYSLENLLCVLIGACVFCIIPTKPLFSLKEKLYSFREKQLFRVAINRNRLMLSNRLFELSGVFSEMSDAFICFKKNSVNETTIKNAIIKELDGAVCGECNNKDKCKPKTKESLIAFENMIDIGLAKGKLSLIDMPKTLADKCVHPNNVLFAINKLLASYRSYVLEHKNMENGRTLIASQTAGVAEILRGLALDTGTTLKYQSRTERALSNSLIKNGFTVSELLIYGEADNLTIGMILTQKEFSLDKLLSVIKDTVNRDMMLLEKTNITEEKFYLSLRAKVNYDAVFGLANAKKDNSIISGDTHAITRISYDKFLVAISDGMGSGKDAENISSVSLSLIESFYKAGMKSELILSTVNKLLSINSEDSFTALDIGVINLNTCEADFIKYGSPYGFILNENGIKILEGNTLPLGILEELKPSVCSTKLNDNDVIVFVSDGVSDAFGQSAEIIDFMRSVPAKNPQTLADSILNKSIELSNGKLTDDMTVLCVRIFKNVS